MSRKIERRGFVSAQSARKAPAVAASIAMERWQQEGFESFRAWRLATEKARRDAKKAVAAAAAASTGRTAFDASASGTSACVAAADASAQATVPAVTSGREDPFAPPPQVAQAEAELVQSPPKKQRAALVEPVRVELTPGGGNVELTLQAESPGGTLLQESFRRVAASPVGEKDDARATRLATERKRLQRAREKLAARLQHRQNALSFALADFDVTVGVNQDADVDELVASLDVASLDARDFDFHPIFDRNREKFEAAKQACALEMATIADSLLTIRDVYDLYPSEERPRYQVLPISAPDARNQCGCSTDGKMSLMVGQLARPDDGRCACGKSLRYECATGCKPFRITVREGTPVLQKVGCERTPFDLIVALEGEQNGSGFAYGGKWPDWRSEREGSWWKGRLETGVRKGSCPFSAPLECKWHQKTLHLADRLCRWSPGILHGSSSRRAMALYRRVTPKDLRGAWSSLHEKDVVLPPGQPTLEWWFVPCL